jgi:ABC-2 type transport system permease protein
MSPVLGRTLAVERRALVGWSAGLAGLGLVTLASWPSVEASSAELSQVLQQLPPGLTAFLGEGIGEVTAAGIIGSRLFGTVGLAAVIAFAVSRGARAIAGEERDGTLGLLVAQPVTRVRIAVDKVVAAATALAVLVVVQQLLLLVADPLLDLGFAAADVVAASTGLYLLAAVFGALAFGAGAATGSRGLAVGTAGGAAAALFLLAGLGDLVEPLRPLADRSPFGLFDGTRVLAEGVPAATLVGFALAAVVLVALGVAAFDRRDLA